MSTAQLRTALARHNPMMARTPDVATPPDGFFVVIPPDTTDDEPIVEGWWDTHEEAQTFLDSEVGSPAARIVEVRAGEIVANPFDPQSAIRNPQS